MAAVSFPSRLAPYESGRVRSGAGLRLVGDGRRRSPIDDDWPSTVGDPRVLALVPDPVPVRRTRRRQSAAVRLRRTLLAVAALMVIGLALPLGGVGGPSHPSGSALAGTTHPVDYTVQPGDTLWSIATAVDPSADPRPVVAKLAAQTGSYTVEPGEHISVP